MAHKSFEAERKAEGRFSNMGPGTCSWRLELKNLRNGLPRVSVTPFAGGSRQTSRHRRQ